MNPVTTIAPARPARRAPAVSRTTRSGVDRCPFLYVTEVDISLDDGPGINEREFVRCLRRDHADRVICILPYPSRPEAFFDPGIEYVFSPRKSVHRYPIYLVATFLRIRRVQRRRGVTAAAFRLGITPFLPLAVGRLLHIPVILKTLLLYAVFGEDDRFRASRTAVANVVSRVGTLLRPAYRRVVADCLLADTPNLAYADWLRERFGIDGNRLIIVPNGFNPEVFSPGDAAAAKRALGLTEEDHVIGYVGRMSGIRHVELLVRCVAALAPALNVHLVLVGEGRDRTALEDLAKRLDVADRVRFVGQVPYGTVPEYMRAFDIALDLTLVTVRMNGGERHASFSQKIAQYLGAGVPVIAFDTPETRFLEWQRIGRVVPAGDQAALTSAVAALLGASLAERARTRDRVRRFALANLTAGRVTTMRVDAWRRAVVRSSPNP